MPGRERLRVNSRRSVAHSSVVIRVKWRQPREGHGIRPRARIDFVASGSRVLGPFDTGADLTLLPLAKMRILRVTDKQCMPISISPLGRAAEFGRLTVMDAHLDGHDFRFPVAFTNRKAVLFGRPGLVDQFRIELDPKLGLTRFTWVGPQSASAGPWTPYYEGRWTLGLSNGMNWQRWEQAGYWLTRQGDPILERGDGRHQWAG